MADIFVSYRRSDSSAIVGHLIDKLESTFGRDNVFRDVEAIEYGEKFSDVIHQALSKCKLLLVIIGDDWLDVQNEAGERRLDNPADWVRQEVSTALKQNIVVIPVLVENTEMPPANRLADDLKGLAGRHAAQVREDPDFDHDVERLCEVIRKHVSQDADRVIKSLPKPLIIGLGVVLSLIVLAVGFSAWPGRSRPSPLPQDTGAIYFLGIGVDKYPFYNLKFAKEDMQRLRETIKQYNPESRVKATTMLGPDATKRRIVDEIEGLRSRLGHDDVAIIAFSGVEAVVNERFFMLPHDVQAGQEYQRVEDNLQTATAVSARDIFQAIPNSKGTIIFWLDTCRSARLARELTEINSSIITFASAGRDELCYEDPGFGESGGGAFTTAVAEGLEGAADTNQDGRVTVKELGDHVRERTPELVNTIGKQQHPVIVGDQARVANVALTFSKLDRD